MMAKGPLAHFDPVCVVQTQPLLYGAPPPFQHFGEVAVMSGCGAGPQNAQATGAGGGIQAPVGLGQPNMHVCGGGGDEPRQKRKTLDFEMVSEKMKRCRIAGIPGEIRLRKDIRECADLGDVSFLDNVRLLQTADPLIVNVRFEARASPCLAPVRPSRPSFFSVRVPKFYPHEPPVVSVPDVAFHGRVPFVGIDGKVTHPLLGRNWCAIGCMKDVIKALCEVRECESEQQVLIHHAAQQGGEEQGEKHESDSYMSIC